MPVYYYIRSTTEKDDETGELLYWSNEYGWTNFKYATAFEYEETLRYNLPNNSNWIT